MANWGIYGFPEPDPTQTKKPRLFNVGAPFPDEIVAHFRADYCFKDLEMSQPCGVGDYIQACQDLSGNGRHAIGTVGELPTLMFEDGFPAINTGGRFLTVPPHSAYTQVAIWRAPGSTFSYHGAVLGRSSGRVYLFYNNRNYFYKEPISTRINGVPTNVIEPINHKKLMVAELHNAGSITTWYLGQSEALYNGHLIVYEVINYAGQLTSEQIAEIEAIYLEKYKI